MLVGLFEIPDLDRDGELSRSELHKAAKGLGWHWQETPVFVLFDLLTILKPRLVLTANSFKWLSI
jgi:hypothetical protein